MTIAAILGGAFMAAVIIVLGVRLRRANRMLQQLRGEKPIVPLPSAPQVAPPVGIGDRDELALQGPKLVRRFIRHGDPFAVAMIEVSHYTERDGPLPRDMAYQAGEVLLATARLEDTICLIDDRTFVVLLTSVDLAAARAFAERARGKVSSTPVRTGAGSAYLIAVAGVADWRLEYRTIEDVVEVARRQMEAEREAIASQRRNQQAG